MLSTLRPVDVRARAEENFGGFHHRFRKRWMRVNRERDVAGQRRHFDGQHAFGDHLACTGSYDAHAQHALGFRIENQLRHAFGAVDGDRTAGGGPGKLGNFDLAIFFLRLRFS